jgi:23S rRNA pseudoU1915 N3-methylase RlmH
MKCTILTISDSDKHFSSACDEYVKRLGKDLTIKIVKPSKGDSQAHTIQKDTDTIVQILEKDFVGWHKVMMSVMGKQMDTVDFHQHCYKQEKILFIIG